MFQKTSELAEKVATNFSRRHFFGSLGRWAGVTALAMAGVFTTVSVARAAGKTCCVYANPFIYGGPRIFECVDGACPPGGLFLGSFKVGDCKKCTGGNVISP
jgi:hypothetical protein